MFVPSSRQHSSAQDTSGQGFSPDPSSQVGSGVQPMNPVMTVSAQIVAWICRNANKQGGLAGCLSCHDRHILFYTKCTKHSYVLVGPLEKYSQTSDVPWLVAVPMPVLSWVSSRSGDKLWMGTTDSELPVSVLSSSCSVEQLGLLLVLALLSAILKILAVLSLLKLMDTTESEQQESTSNFFFQWNRSLPPWNGLT